MSQAHRGRRSEIKIHATRVFSRPSLPRGPSSCNEGTSRGGERRGMTRNRGGEGDLTEFANQISSLVYEILSEGAAERERRGALAFVPIIVPKPTPSISPVCSCVPPVSATKLLHFGNDRLVVGIILENIPSKGRLVTIFRETISRSSPVNTRFDRRAEIRVTTIRNQNFDFNRPTAAVSH